MNGMILQGNASLAEIIVSLKGSLGSEIVKGCNHLKGGAGRICTIGSTIQKAAVILIIYKRLPVLCYGIGIKVRLAHLHKTLACGWFNHHHSASSISKGIICHILKIGIQGGNNRISCVLGIQKLILQLGKEKGVRGQQRKIRL